MGAKLARRLLAFRRVHPQTRIHLIAYSGGAGIGVFALETLGPHRPIIETLLLACPALSPSYNLGPALRGVTRAYALISHKDTGILGLGTRIFGTTDRRFTSAAGCTGFKVPCDCSDEDRQAYDRLREIHWTPDLRELGHTGGHTGWASVLMLRRHLMSILRGQPLLPTLPVSDACL
jgi:pimeloyl-ACP methyl ester carboxylesterase